ncbi:hypothetical protein M2138_002122 [Dysgonomonadaceae bacterium PH5-43]|nr:hypothetical protein [Dysgonomonadaceae bacterium PH5-43]
MSLETSSGKLVEAMHEIADAGLSKEVASTVKTHAWIGAFCMAVPLWGLEIIVYAATLWHMYKKLCDLAKVPFWKNFMKSILGGFIINNIVVFVLNLILDFIPIAGWIGAGLIGFATIFFSGCAYLEVLAKIHGDRKVKERFNTQKAFRQLNSNESDKKITS